MQIFRYGVDEINHLRKKDKKLGRAIDEIGMIRRKVTPDIFIALISSVASQQISAKAAETVWNRMEERFHEITPDVIASAAVDDIQMCGMSIRKSGYIKGIGQAVMEGKLDLAGLIELSDEEVIAHLTELKGVGIWTAELILIFSMERPDVVSHGDLAIQRGMMKLYGKPALSRETFERYRKRYSPFGSVASLYLWEISHR
jgi:3-methyladenine DNA glycosylase/8-oxoguanine DNA glycosylase